MVSVLILKMKMKLILNMHGIRQLITSVVTVIVMKKMRNRNLNKIIKLKMNTLSLLIDRKEKPSIHIKENKLRLQIWKCYFLDNGILEYLFMNPKIAFK